MYVHGANRREITYIILFGGDIMAIRVSVVNGEPVVVLDDKVENSIVLVPQIVDGVLVYNIVY